LIEEVYRNASYGLSWLGPEGENSSLALNIMRECAREIRGLSHQEDVTWLERFADLLGMPADSIAALPKRTWKSINSLFWLTYMERSWKFQELLVPKHVVVLYGSAICPLNNLVQFYDWWTNSAKSIQCPHFFHPVF
jgi:hypothetical protein